MPRVLIVFASRAGETEKIGELIAEGLRFAGAEAKLAPVNSMKKEADLQGYDGLVFGSATYHGEMMPGMKTLLFLAEKADLAGKVGGAFGAFGWSGEGPDRIFDTMKHILKMEMVSGPLRLKSSLLGGGMQMAQAYGRQVAEKLTAA